MNAALFHLIPADVAGTGAVMLPNSTFGAPSGRPATAVPTQVAVGPGAPSAPTVTGTTSGGSLGSQDTYFVVTYTLAAGVGVAAESIASSETHSTTASSHLFKVTSPATHANADGYNVYAGVTGGPYYLQTPTPIALATDWTEPTSGMLVSGNNPPVATKATKYTKLTYLNSSAEDHTIYGESLPSSTEASRSFTDSRHVLHIASPATHVDANYYNVYVGVTGGPYYLQNATPIAIGTAWQEPLTGLLASGQQPPAHDTTSGFVTPLKSFAYIMPDGQPKPFYKGIGCVVDPHVRNDMVAKGLVS
jgi:hypothetical protein